MNDLKLIGYWGERPGDRLPNPKLFVDWSLWTAEFRRAVCEHLSSGKEVIDELGLSFCRFHCGISNRQLGTRELSDGVWAWPEGLRHYVEVHGVILPEEFADHVASAVGFEDVDLENIQISTVAWRKWADEHQSSISRWKRFSVGGIREILRR